MRYSAIYDLRKKLTIDLLNKFSEYDDYLIFGDFNLVIRDDRHPRDASENANNEVVYITDHVKDKQIVVNVYPEKATTTGNKPYDNIIASKDTRFNYKRVANSLTTNAGIFVYNSNYAIDTDPNYLVSDHYPIYALLRDEFKIIY